MMHCPFASLIFFLSPERTQLLVALRTSAQMEKATVERHGDSDSGQSPSDHEKGTEESPIDVVNREVPDPDAHLSEEERKKL
jgi:hypothetical protein